jgi:hypothetical protein
VFVLANGLLGLDGEGALIVIGIDFRRLVEDRRPEGGEECREFWKVLQEREKERKSGCVKRERGPAFVLARHICSLW